MSNVIDLTEVFRRQQDAKPPPQEWRHRTIIITDLCTLHEVSHERREVVQAGIDFLCADVEAWGNGGWGEFGRPQFGGSEYFATGITVRFPDGAG